MSQGPGRYSHKQGEILSTQNISHKEETTDIHCSQQKRDKQGNETGSAVVQSGQSIENRSTIAVPLGADKTQVPPCGPSEALKEIHVLVLAPEDHMAVMEMV